ncbi:hypothetical protein CYMTET_24280, partial [Cymbomonas tetramitiformis]
MQHFSSLFGKWLLVALCASALLQSSAHTTDVCWIWDDDGQGITFYVATWHDEGDFKECDINKKIDSQGSVTSCRAGSDGCLFCPLTVTSTTGDVELFADIFRFGAAARCVDIFRFGAAARCVDIFRFGAAARCVDIFRFGAAARCVDIFRFGAAA